MSLDCTAESVDLRSMATIVERVYVFVNDRLGASSESVELVLFNDFERQTSGLAAAAVGMVRSASLSKLGMHMQSDPLSNSLLLVGTHGYGQSGLVVLNAYP